MDLFLSRLSMMQHNFEQLILNSSSDNATIYIFRIDCYWFEWNSLALSSWNSIHFYFHISPSLQSSINLFVGFLVRNYLVNMWIIQGNRNIVLCYSIVNSPYLLQSKPGELSVCRKIWPIQLMDILWSNQNTLPNLFVVCIVQFPDKINQIIKQIILPLSLCVCIGQWSNVDVVLNARPHWIECENEKCFYAEYFLYQSIYIKLCVNDGHSVWIHWTSCFLFCINFHDNT